MVTLRIYWGISTAKIVKIVPRLLKIWREVYGLHGVVTSITVRTYPARWTVGITSSGDKVTCLCFTTGTASLATITIVTVVTATTAVITMVTRLTLASSRLAHKAFISVKFTYLIGNIISNIANIIHHKFVSQLLTFFKDLLIFVSQ